MKEKEKKERMLTMKVLAYGQLISFHHHTPNIPFPRMEQTVKLKTPHPLVADLLVHLRHPEGRVGVEVEEEVIVVVVVVMVVVVEGR